MTTTIAANIATKNAAFYYHPDGYETSRANLMGRHAAGDGFLQGFCRHSGVDSLYCYAQTQEHFEHFKKQAKHFSSTAQTHHWIPWTNWQELSQVGCLFVPGPDLSNLAWQRRYGDQRAFSLFGITHTTASAKIMDGIGQLLLAPLQPWDAVVCTSESVRKMMQQVVSNYGVYLKDKFRLPALPDLPVQFPVIPLGVNCPDFDLPEDERTNLRKQWRQNLQIAEDDFVALYVGRLSFHAKAHPMPMYSGLELAAQKSGTKIHLILSGWFPNKSIQADFIDGAKKFCPSVKIHCVDGRKTGTRHSIWYAADVFTSLSDNIQETFGLTPIEAMAAGLPVVVSDWDGYKETVRHGIDGFRIPTWIPPVGQSSDVALAHAMGAINYDYYIGYQSQYTAVDIAECARSYLRLIEDPSLRLEMAAAGKKRAKAMYDWSIIVQSYQKLWEELAKLRQSGKEYVSRQAHRSGNPLRDDPTALFGHYATHILKRDTTVRFADHIQVNNVQKLQSLVQSVSMNTLGSGLRYSGDELTKLLSRLSKEEPVTVQNLCADVPNNEVRTLSYTLIWLSKMGIVQLGQIE